MTASARPATPAPTLLPAPRHRPWSRVFGFASVYAKTIRDARLSFLIVLGLTAGLMLSVTSAIPSAFPTQQARDEMARLATDMGAVAQGLAGKPVNVGTLGGYAQWKYGAFFALILSLWSILALSGTLAGEARRGSLDILAVTPIGRRRLAGEKLAAHLTLVAAVVVAIALAAWVAGAAFGTLPGDAIPLDRAAGFGLWVGLMALAFGSLAFALSQVVGRGAGAAIAGALLVGGWVLNGYAPSVPLFAPFALLTPWAWTGGHLPLAGQSDWASLLPVALVAVVALPAGVRLFERRDLGDTRAIRLPRLLSLPKGLSGPLARSVGERLPAALAWAIGIGLYGLFVAAASRSFVDELAKSPDIARFFQGAFPGADMLSAGRFLQFVFMDIGIVVAGFAAAVLVAGWASDETSGRVEQLLTAPVGRRAWAARSAAGVLVAIGAITAVLMAAVALGSAAAGSDWLTPFLGAIPVGLYAAAMAGVGIAVGGLWRPSLAAEVVALVVIATFLVQILGPLLGLPDAVQQLALTQHLGRPMIWQWDWPGMAACIAIALGGVALGAWGFGRRDVRD
jgi:ABC-2 type transport system permease protein